VLVTGELVKLRASSSTTFDGPSMGPRCSRAEPRGGVKRWHPSRPRAGAGDRRAGEAPGLGFTIASTLVTSELVKLQASFSTTFD